MAAQLARNRGAAVFGVGSQTQRSMTENLGATLVPYDSGDVVEQMRQLLPGGVNAILDMVGGEAMRHVAILITNPAGIVSVADPGVAQPGGSFLQSSRAGVPAVANLVAAGKADPKVLQISLRRSTTGTASSGIRSRARQDRDRPGAHALGQGAVSSYKPAHSHAEGVAGCNVLSCRVSGVHRTTRRQCRKRIPLRDAAWTAMACRRSRYVADSAPDLD